MNVYELGHWARGPSLSEGGRNFPGASVVGPYFFVAGGVYASFSLVSLSLSPPLLIDTACTASTTRSRQASSSSAPSSSLLSLRLNLPPRNPLLLPPLLRLLLLRLPSRGSLASARPLSLKPSARMASGSSLAGTHFVVYWYNVRMARCLMLDRETSTPVVIVIDANQTLVINGTLILQPETHTTITLNPIGPGAAPIIVTGEAQIDGTLVIVLTAAATNGTLVPIVGGAGDIDGTFTGVEVTGPHLVCEEVDGYIQQETSGTIGVMLTVGTHCGKKKRALSNGQIAGIVVGAILFVALLVAILAILFKRLRPHHDIFNSTVKQEEAEWR